MFLSHSRHTISSKVRPNEIESALGRSGGSGVNTKAAQQQWKMRNELRDYEGKCNIEEKRDGWDN